MIRSSAYRRLFALLVLLALLVQAWPSAPVQAASRPAIPRPAAARPIAARAEASPPAGARSATGLAQEAGIRPFAPQLPTAGSDSAAAPSDRAAPEATWQEGMGPGAAPFDPAYVTDVDLGDGRRAAVLTSTPANYLAPDGAWQPIDPRFEAVAGGFASQRNLLQITAAAAGPSLQMRHAGTIIGWEPLKLVLASGAETTSETVLALPAAPALHPPREARGTERGDDSQGLPSSTLSADGRTVAYAGSWDLPGLHDEVTAGPGQVEHNLIFAGLPLPAEASSPAQGGDDQYTSPLEALPRPEGGRAGGGDRGGAEARLILRAVLRLPAGTQIYADGLRQSGEFTTGGSIELRPAGGDSGAGTLLRLAPARVFEQADPEQAITARYHFQPQGDGGWLVSMETPWAWWTDPSRQFPVVWDPAFALVGNVQVEEVRQSGGTQPGCLTYGLAAGIGVNGPCGEVRALVRFNGLSASLFPPGYTIERAQLVVGAGGGLQPVINGRPAPARVFADVHRVTSAWTAAWPGPAIDPTPLCSRLEPYYDPTYAAADFCDIQNGNNGIVSGWLAGQPNNGLLLKLASGVPGQEWYGYNFVTVPQQARWKSSPGGGLIFDPALAGQGFALVIHYRGPQLPEGVPYQYGANPPRPPTPDGDAYLRTYHSYALPPANDSPWLAVAAKGYRTRITYSGVVKDGLFSYAFWSQNEGLQSQVLPGAPPLNPPREAGGTGQPQGAAPTEGRADAAPAGVSPEAALPPPAYAFPISAVRPNCLGSGCALRSAGDGSDDGSNFLLLRGAASSREFRVEAVAPDPRLEQYAVEAVRSQSLGDIDPVAAYDTGVVFTRTLSLPSSEIVQLFHLKMLANTRVGISLKTNVEGMYQPSATAQAHLYPPTSADGWTKQDGHKIVKDFYPQRMLVDSSHAGDWAVLLELPGDLTAFDLYQDAPVDTEPKERTIDVDVVVRVCPRNAIPTDSGCAFVVKPEGDPNDPQDPRWWAAGPYRIFSPAGFVTCGSQTCTNRFQGGKEYSSIITWDGVTKRVVVVSGDQIRFDAANLYTGYRGIVSLGIDPPGEVEPIFELWQGPGSAPLAGAGVGFMTHDNCFIGGAQDCNAALVLEPHDRSSIERFSLYPRPSIQISMVQSPDDLAAQYAEVKARILRPVQTETGVQSLPFELSWQVDAYGYEGWPESPEGYGPSETRITPLAAAAPTAIASMTFHHSGAWAIHYEPTVGTFDRLRSDNGRIVHDAGLGGAWTYVDYVVLPFGLGPSGSSGLDTCPGFCGDIRHRDDTWQAPRRDWKMPDVLVNQQPKTVMVSSDGALSVYSTDYPFGQSLRTEPGAADQTSASFSFKTFDANVEVTEGVCPGSGQRTTLIRGRTFLSLPGVDAAPAGPEAKDLRPPSIEATFTLCEDALRQVSLTFDAGSTPGVPIAQPPLLWLTLIGGTVTIGPENVRIVIDVHFYMGSSVPRVFKGTARLTIDTLGIFDMQAQGRIMGVMDGEGHLWVAWNPLDMGLGNRGYLPSRDAWLLSGFMYAHVWRGAGWQNRYPWLAGNDDLHLTASMQAIFRVTEGSIIDEWPIVVPPGSVEVRVELSFGQFCANDGCSEYQWGIKGKLDVAGFSVGAYVNLECPELRRVPLPAVALLCTSFILGSDGHVLLDQYGGNGPPFPLASAGEPVRSEVERRAVADPGAPQVDEPLEVRPTTGSFLVAFGWVRGQPGFALVRPDGAEITAANAASYGVEVTSNAHSLLFGVPQPVAGTWLARVTGAEIDTDYRLMFFANKEPPLLAFTAPVGDQYLNAISDSTSSEYYRIEWQPPENAEGLRLSLFYSATVTSATDPGYQYGGAIVEGIDPGVGYFDWDLSFLGSGDYRVYATLQDRAGARTSATGENQYVGLSTSIAPGTIHWLDLVPPPPPNAGALIFTPATDGVDLCWDPSPAHDLAYYAISYYVWDSFRGGGWGQHYQEYVLAGVPAGPGARQCTRLGGLVPEETTVYFGGFPGLALGLAAIDASNNQSGYAESGFTTVPLIREERLASLALSGVANGDGSVTLTWPEAAATRYELYYAPETPAGPWQPASGAAEGPSPVVVDDLSFTGSLTLHGLAPGHWYAFAVRYIGLSSYAISDLSNQVWLPVTGGVDGNGDGCPDDWQAAHNAPDVTANPDGDGLTNGQECQRGTDPHRPDTDGDDWSDGEEVHYETDPLDATSHPQITPENVDQVVALPRLGLSTNRLSIHAFTGGPNPGPFTVEVRNLGGGTLTPSATPDVAWATVSVVGGDLVVQIDKSGLARGRYPGAVTVRADPASTQSSPQVLLLDLQLLAGDDPDLPPAGAIYLPLVRRQQR